MVDEILNAFLFVLIGLERVILTFAHAMLVAGIPAIPMALSARLISVSGPVTVLEFFRPFSKGAIRVMTWGGIRGGISVALALSLPEGPERDIIVAVTYAIVVFSILVQGLTLGPLLRRILRDDQPKPAR